MKHLKLYENFNEDWTGQEIWLNEGFEKVRSLTDEENDAIVKKLYDLSGGEEVYVHLNLNQPTRYSVKDKNQKLLLPKHGDDSYPEKIKLKDVSFHINRAGQKAVTTGVMRNGKLVKEKNVHAFIVGKIVPDGDYPTEGELIGYNPKKYPEIKDFYYLDTEKEIPSGKKIFKTVVLDNWKQYATK